MASSVHPQFVNHAIYLFMPHLAFGPRRHIIQSYVFDTGCVTRSPGHPGTFTNNIVDGMIYEGMGIDGYPALDSKAIL
ncbi:hypothetical protein BBBOND_0402560 [Babesia bigemina]|uniref:Uncharacterized protein n=1 Tax=Babesia bigemina TaxID=5866 RepID=A0A061DB55_BABBI|nr:hypothetical protein BBBOND_0402560 [Babesia bigemina]CDR97768.1 hypothetical protein BBBOND_0402560 [Babesia bigemina]|eukprot:XP_012769954.1 hypothetical protein BBBOND_0402560 [Babesia bigemina]